MERQAKSSGKIAAKLKVGVGFCAAQPVMQMRDMKHEAQFPAPLSECAQQRNRISPAGNADSQAHAWLEQGCVERELRRRCAHDWMHTASDAID